MAGRWPFATTALGDWRLFAGYLLVVGAGFGATAFLENSVR